MQVDRNSVALAETVKFVKTEVVDPEILEVEVIPPDGILSIRSRVRDKTLAALAIIALCGLLWLAIIDPNYRSFFGGVASSLVVGYAGVQIGRLQ